MPPAARPCGASGKEGSPIRQRILAVLLLCCLLFSLFGCREEEAYLRYDLSGQVATLDPQFCTDGEAAIILDQLFEGLLRQEEDGSLTGAAAESWQVSADGRTYTFTLRQNTWSDGQPVTSGDFLFAFQRIFSPQSPSPFAEELAVIQNASAVLAGTASLESLGVSAPDDRTLVIALESPSASFAGLLAQSCTYPCREDLFTEARGRYGLEREYLVGNGAFELIEWDTANLGRIGLKRRGSSEAGQVAYLYFYMGREDAAALFDEKKSDLIRMDSAGAAALGRSDYVQHPFENITWCLAVNSASSPYDNEQIRRALFSALEPDAFAGLLTDDYAPADSLVPPCALVGQTPYRQLAQPQNPCPHDTEAAQAYLTAGLLEEGLDRLPRTSVILPENNTLQLVGGHLQQMWQNELSLYFNLEPLPEEEFYARLAAGDYQLAILPVSCEDSSPAGVLGQFSGGEENLIRLESGALDSALAGAASASSENAAAAAYARAEEALITGGLYPLAWQTSYFLVDSDFEGVAFSPSGGRIWFDGAREAS